MLAGNESDDRSVRAWLLAAMQPFRVDTAYFDDLGQALDRSAPPAEC